MDDSSLAQLLREHNERIMDAFEKTIRANAPSPSWQRIAIAALGILLALLAFLGERLISNSDSIRDCMKRDDVRQTVHDLVDSSLLTPGERAQFIGLAARVDRLDEDIRKLKEGHQR